MLLIFSQELLAIWSQTSWMTERLFKTSNNIFGNEFLNTIMSGWGRWHSLMMMKYLSIPAITDMCDKKAAKKRIETSVPDWNCQNNISLENLGFDLWSLHVTHDASWWDGRLPEDRSYLTGNDRGDLPQVRSWWTASEQASPHQALQVPQAGNQVVITQLKISKTMSWWP